MPADRLLGSEPSRVVTSNQSTVHRHLTAVVRKHRLLPYRRPVSAHSKAQFERLDAIVNAHGGPVILDSGCGTGEFSHALASSHSDHLVIGIDKSRARIGRAAATEAIENLVIARADCADLWRLAYAAGWQVARHYLLYPNPWPKAKHLQRRWHGHPVFSTLVDLGGLLELRSNWEIYINEFALALQTIGAGRADVERLDPRASATPFERKYRASGHRLYRLSAQLINNRPATKDPVQSEFARPRPN